MKSSLVIFDCDGVLIDSEHLGCIAETRDPHWITQRLTFDEKLMFHMIHSLHLAGRCVECGSRWP